MTHQTTVALDARVPALLLSRDFDASPAQVFRAWTEADLVVRWLGPRGLDMELERWDASTGGAYRYVHRRGTDEHWFHGSFHEVRPDELIVQTFTWEAMPDDVALETVRFTDLRDGRTRMTSTSLAGSFESRDAMVSSGMEEGIHESFERLDEVLAG